jgi:A/G-specific adenine glycosylase
MTRLRKAAAGKPTIKRDSRGGGAQAWTSRWRRNAREKLLAWYRENARDLTWRRTRDPYAIWVSEIMLQQTQVATVERYFSKFLAAFPTIAALGAGREQDVLRLWEGLGYYRRARQLHAAAKRIVAEHGGRFPRDFETVCTLPGIGRYTAGAILSIAFDQQLPILEANTIRLLSRLTAFRSDPASSAGRTHLWKAAEALLDGSGNGDMNQALMEVGSLICTPREPRCDVCPLGRLCPTRRLGLQEEIPRAKVKAKVEEVREAAVIIVDRGRVLLRQCGDGERWAGLWDFPRFAVGKVGSRKSEIGKQLVDGALFLTDVTISDVQHFVRLRHTVTRFRITLDCYVGKRAEKRGNGKRSVSGDGDLRWVKAAELDGFPLSTTGRKLARLWCERGDDTAG